MKFSFLYNPFERIAGWHSLMLGLIIMLLTSLIGSFSGTHFDGMLDFHFGKTYPYYVFLFEIMVSWLTASAVFYAGGLLLSESSIRIIDVFGTQALARAPFLLAAPLGFLPFFRTMDISNIPKLTIIGIISIVFVIWVAALMFHAYRVSCNLRGNRLILSYIAALIIGEAISKFVIIYTLKQYFNTNLLEPLLK